MWKLTHIDNVVMLFDNERIMNMLLKIIKSKIPVFEKGGTEKIKKVCHDRE